jgi:hypothetical protein
MAFVEKSTINPMMGIKRISAISAPARIFLEGWPGAGFVRWHSVTGPPKTVAQDGKVVIRIAAKASEVKTFLITVFFVNIDYITVQINESGERKELKGN